MSILNECTWEIWLKESHWVNYVSQPYFSTPNDRPNKLPAAAAVANKI